MIGFRPHDAPEALPPELEACSELAQELALILPGMGTAAGGVIVQIKSEGYVEEASNDNEQGYRIGVSVDAERHGGAIPSGSDAYSFSACRSRVDMKTGNAFNFSGLASN